MTLGSLLLFAHITTMIAAVTVSFGPGTVLGLAIRRGQNDLVRGVILATATTERLIPPLYIAGGLLGLLTAINFGFNLLAPWLVIAYVLFAVAMVTGIAVHTPYHKRLEKLFDASPGGPISAEAAIAIADRRELSAELVDYVVIVAILFDMVVKPFS